MFRLPFIYLPSIQANGLTTAHSTASIFERLNAGLNARAIVPMVGANGAGKSRLLEELARSKTNRNDPAHTLLVRLPEQLPKRARAKNERVTPTTMILFSRLLYGLRKRSQWAFEELDADDKWRTVMAQNEAPLHGLNDFEWVRARVELGITKLPTLRLLIDNADIDITSLDELLQLWKDTGEMFGMVLCKRLEEHAEVNEPFGELLNALPHVKGCCTDALIIEPMTRAQFDPPHELAIPHSVVADILLALEANVSAEVERRFDEFIERLWKRSQGNWVSLTTFVTVLDQRLGSGSQRPRLLTQAMIDATFDQLAGVRKVW